jgi:hypothetical protein
MSGKIDYLFIIYSCEKNLSQANKIFHTYSDALKLINIHPLIVYGDTSLDTNYTLIEDKYLVLNVEDDYEHLNVKSLRLFKTIATNYPQIKGCFKCDDDIILNVVSIGNFLSNLQHLNIDYSGITTIMNKKEDAKRVDHRNINITLEYDIENPSAIYCGGPLYYVSNKSLQILQKTKEDVVKKIFYEDKMIGHVLNQKGIYPTHYCLYSDNITEFNTKRTSYHNFNHKKTLFLRVHGGLGNQMFQIASGYGIAKDNDMNFIIINSSIIKRDFTHIADNNMLFETIFSQFPNTELKYIKDISNLGHLFKEEEKDCFIFKPKSFDADVILSGYFQNETYFNRYKEELLYFFKTTNEYERLKKIFCNKNGSVFKNSYFIHVRRGDYVNNALHEIDYDAYYTKAIQTILESDAEAHFFIFSNDIEYCKTYSVLNDINKKFVKNDNCVESIYLMSFCEKGGICANSSFSWWASYLNTNPKKIVTFPSKWLNNTWENDIYYENSIIIQI